VHKISTTLAAMSLLAPMGASALGIGDIRLHSALNQTLSAEIPLVTSGTESLSDVRVTLASPDAFSRAGIERHYALSKLRFSAIQKSDGSYVIKVSSRDVIREPFLNFLLEVNWPQGRLFREFTVLLDPPSTFQETSVDTPSLPETEQPPRSDDATPTGRSPHYQDIPRDSGSVEPSRPASRARISGSEFGPVRRDETLWNIAKLINRDPSITPEQMVIALYEANPQAFYQDSVNALRAGERLKIPDRETILRLSPQEAKAQFYRQARAGKLSARREERLQPETAKTAAPGEEQPQGQLKLVAPSEGKTKAESAVPETKEDGPKSKGDIALEVADTVKQENEEIRSRLAELEQQLSTMQRMLSLKNEQIATLEAQQKQPAQTGQPAESVPAKSAVAQEPPPQVELPATPELPKETVATPTPAAVPMAPPKVSPTPAAVKPAPAQPPEEADFFSELLDEPFYLGLGVAFTLLLGLLTRFAMRRREAMNEEMESILAASDTGKSQKVQLTPPVLDETPSEQIATPAKSSFLSEFTPSDFDALGGESDEVDPISEADVYLAYGRYKQAEELIRSAIEQYPERDECKLKLLEIHYATENKSAFESYAKELYKQNKDADPDFWDKVVEMGRELCPQSSLFSSATLTDLAGGDPVFVAPDTLGGLSDSMDLDEDLIADLKRFEEAHRKPKPAAEPSQAVSSNPLKEEAAAAAPSPARPEKLSDSFASLEFDVASFQEEDSVQKTPVGQPELEFDNLIQFETVKQSTISTEAMPQPQRDKTLDDILLELGAKTEPKPAKSGAASLTDQQPSDEFDFDLELLSPPTTRINEKLALPENEDPYVDLTDMDEQETKLDLAKAYVDMGDETTAREILEDILNKGKDGQKKEAQTWLNKLARN